jgi:hypothetical protein
MLPLQSDVRVQEKRYKLQITCTQGVGVLDAYECIAHTDHAHHISFHTQPPNDSIRHRISNATKQMSLTQTNQIIACEEH